jgi:hypothetical protein
MKITDEHQPEALPAAKNLEQDILFSPPQNPQHNFGEPPVSQLENHQNIGVVNSNSCGISWNRDDKTFDIEDAPWMVQLRYNETLLNGEFYCAGILISGLFCASQRFQLF